MTSHVNESHFVQTSGTPVTLRITVGYTQAGGSYVLFVTAAGATEIFPNANGDYIVTPLPNSILSCVTTVQDTNPNTNNTSVIHTFTNLIPAAPFTYTRAVDHHNDKVVYDIQYIFS